MEKAKVVGFIPVVAPAIIKKKYVQKPLKLRLAPLLAKVLKSKGL